MYDEDIIAEYEDVLHRVKFQLLPETADALISHIIESSSTCANRLFRLQTHRHHAQ